MKNNSMKKEWNHLIVAAGILGLSAVASAKGNISSVQRKDIGHGVQFVITGSDLGTPKIISVNGGTDYIVQFAAGIRHGEYFSVHKSGVAMARLCWYDGKNNVSRFLVRKNSTEHPVLTKTSTGYLVSINTPEWAYHPSKSVVVWSNPRPKAVALSTPAGPKTKITKAISKTSPLRPVTYIAPKALVFDEKTTPKVTKSTEKAPPKVSLEFVNADVVQILKALALQAGVNIVTSPEVSGKKITVSLNHVTVQDALDFVTAIAGLKYAEVSGSYVVSDIGSFGSIMTDLADKTNSQNVMRIVPIVSGDGASIKQALQKWFGVTTLQVIVPGEPTSSAGGAASGAAGSSPAGGASGPGGTPSGGSSSTGQAAPGGVSPDTGSGSKAPYLVLIGAETWVDQAQKVVAELDSEIIEAKTSQMNAQFAAEQQQKMAEQQFSQKLLQSQQSGQTQQTYTVRNGVGEDLVNVLKSRSEFSALDFIASPKASRTQVVVVTGPDSMVKSATETLAMLDAGSGQEDVEYYMYDIRYADPRSLRETLLANVPGLIVANPPASAGNPGLFKSGVTTSQSNQTNQSVQQQGSSGGSSNNQQTSVNNGAGSMVVGNSQFADLIAPFQANEDIAYPMRLLLKGSHEQVEEALAFLKQVDIAPRQMAIEMRVMELSKEDAQKLGINWSILTGGAVKAISLNESQNGIGGNASPANTIAGHIGGRGWSSDVGASLDAIANKNNLIARPNLLCLDGRESEIFVGDDVKYVQSIQSSQNGVSVTTGDVPVGVRLAVLPRIGGDGQITMDLRPTVSVLKSFTAVPGGGNLPQTSLRVAQSTVQVHSGETIAIGGLIQDSDLLDVQKVPILGDLPILGQLFRQTTHDRQRTEVVFFLTVKEVGTDDRQVAADPSTSEKAYKPERKIDIKKILP